MRVLLDGNLPSDFAALLLGHEAETIHQRRWSDLANGALLNAAEAEYDAFITLDQSLRFQQNLVGRSMAILVLRSKSSRLADLQPLVAEVLHVLPTAPAGQVTFVGG